MAPLEFDPVLLTGDAEIDGQHRELFARAGSLLEATRAGRSHGEVAAMLEFLGGYVVDHFESEERVMEATGYERLHAHRLEHRDFVKDLDALRAELGRDGASTRFVMRFNTWVTDYLREHIYRADRHLGEWLRGRARPA